MDVCAGGTIGAGATSITFTNNHTKKCTITSCDMPGWPTTDPVIPKREGGVAGTQVVSLGVAAVAGNTYTYTPDCCDQGTPPQIKVQ
jgi:hypothetical protein